MDFLLYLAMIPALGVAAQWLAWRTNLPSILLLLLFGVILGQFVQLDALLATLTQGESESASNLLFPLVSLSVAVIMFEGGLSLQIRELRESGSAALRLCTVGAGLTWIGASIAAHYTLDYGWRISALLGAILVVTGPTVIGPLLRQVRPSRRVGAALKWEGIVIDPIGAVLAVLAFEQLMLNPEEAGLWTAILMLAKTAAIGVGFGVAGGFALTMALRRFLIPDNLQGVFVLSLALLLFAISNHLAHESGLITVTVLGIWMTNQHGFDIQHIIEFKENLRTLLIGALFIILGSRVDLADVLDIGVPGLIFLWLLIGLVRPVAVMASLIGTQLDVRERAFIAALAPRGIVAAAVSSVFALEMERNTNAMQMAGADQLVTVTFFVIVGTVTVYGLAASPLAKWLGLADQNNNGVLIAGADAWVRDFAAQLKKAGLRVVMVDTNFNKIAKARIEGIEGVCANILNDQAREELPLAGIGRMLAMTPNDEVNSLAVRECRHLFDRADLYQLSFNTENTRGRRGLTPNLMGRELFGKGRTFTQLRDMHAVGSNFKTTTLSEEFDYEDFLKKYQNGFTLLAMLDEDGDLVLNTVDDPIAPEPGDTILALVASITVPEQHASRGQEEATPQDPRP